MTGQEGLDDANGGRAASGWFGWTAADLLWERRAEAAVRAWRRGDLQTAEDETDRALELAEARFARGDPRLASGYTNRGVLLFARGLPRQATAPFDHAVRAWTECWAWLPPASGAPTSDDESSARAAAWSLVERARELTDQARRGEPLPTDGLEVWRQRGPSSPHGLRKVMAAVLLVLPGQPSARASSR